MDDVIVPVVLFGTLPLVVWIVTHFRSKAHQRVTEIMKLMVERGEEITPAKVKALGIQSSQGHRDLKVGMILVAISFGLVILGGAVGQHDAEGQTGLNAIASFPFLIGLVYIFFWFMFGRKKQAD